MKFFARLSFLFIFCVSLFFLTNDIYSQKSSPVIVKTGIQLLSIDQLDLYKGTYAMDYHLVLSCSRVCPTFTFEIRNGSNSQFSIDKNLPKFKVYRIKTILQSNFDARNYPFDSYWLHLDIKDQNLDASKLRFVVDPSLTIVDPSVILHGWQYHSQKIAMTLLHTPPLMNAPFSHYIFSIKLERPILMGFMKVIFPAVIIMFFAFISFVISADKSLNRFGIVSGAFIGSVIFHLNLTSSLPPFGYLTFTDSFMLVNYFTLFIIVFENVYIMHLVDDKKEHFAINADRVCLVAIPILWLALQLTNVLFFFVWYKL